MTDKSLRIEGSRKRVGLIKEKSSGKKKVKFLRTEEWSLKHLLTHLYKNFKSDSVILVELDLFDFIGATIHHIFYHNDTEENVWWNPEVVDLGVTSEDKSNAN